MRGTRVRPGWCAAFILAACGGKHGPSIDDYLPPLPPTGGPTGAYARPVATTADLLTGPAAQGLVGDTLLGNERARFVIQAPGRAIGVVPPGGNVVDAALVDAAG